VDPNNVDLRIRLANLDPTAAANLKHMTDEEVAAAKRISNAASGV
jgi:hypothetical protein